MQRRGLHLQSVHIIIKLAIVTRSDVSLELVARVRRDGRLSERVRNLDKCMPPAHTPFADLPFAVVARFPKIVSKRTCASTARREKNGFHGISQILEELMNWHEMRIISNFYSFILKQIWLLLLILNTISSETRRGVFFLLFSDVTISIT